MALSYIYEPPGDTHTLIVPEGVGEMMTWFHNSGGYTYVDPQGAAVGYEDVFTKIDAAKRHYSAIGLGADYVNRFIRLTLAAASSVEEVFGGEASDGGVEQFDHVEGGEFLFARSAKAAHELEETAGVGGDDGVGVSGEQVGDFAVAELLGGFGLEQVVNAGGPAAER